jgi:hypothetical protein
MSKKNDWSNGSDNTAYPNWESLCGDRYEVLLLLQIDFQNTKGKVYI